MYSVHSPRDETLLTSVTTAQHWHGLFQHTTNWADGPAWVTQCPITTGNSFLYDFRVPDQAGASDPYCVMGNGCSSKRLIA